MAIVKIHRNLFGEIINGRLETHPRTASKHAYIAERLYNV